MRFKDKVCLVTGGGSGIGKATCDRFAAEGAKVLVIDLDPEHGDQAVADITAKGGQAKFSKCDVGNPAEIQAAVKLAVDQWGKIDVLVNNAGIALGMDPAQLAKLSDWDTMVATNVTGLLHVARALLSGMAARDRGHVVNLGSVAATYP